MWAGRPPTETSRFRKAVHISTPHRPRERRYADKSTQHQDQVLNSPPNRANSNPSVTQLSRQLE